MSLERTTAVIMAGGGGTRLWPLSRAGRPKQSLAILSGRTLFQKAVDRLRPELPIERILVVSVDAMAGLLQSQVPELAAENFLNEPSPRGTASVIGLAATVLNRRSPETVMACLTADHLIQDEQRFLAILGAAEARAVKGDLVTLGVTPSFASTGYGYIHVGELVGDEHGFSAHKVRKFSEKPSQELAEEYLASGEYVWNAGMFVWTAERILQEIERLMPDLYAGLQEIVPALGTETEQPVIAAVWDRLESETIDYGIMERANNVVVIPADELGWHDIGGWDRLAELVEADPDGNVVLADVALSRGTREAVIYQQPGVKRLIATLGIEKVVIVDTEDVLLVCALESTEQVRNLAASLSESGLEEYS